MEFQEISNFLGHKELHLMIKNYQNLLLKNGLESMINQKNILVLTTKLESNGQC